MGVVGANGAESGRSSCGVLQIGHEVEVKKAQGRIVAEGGGRHSVSGRWETTSPDLIGHEAGDSGGIGGRPG